MRKICWILSVVAATSQPWPASRQLADETLNLGVSTRRFKEEAHGRIGLRWGLYTYIYDIYSIHIHIHIQIHIQIHIKIHIHICTLYRHIYIYMIAIGYCRYSRSSSRYSIHKLQFLYIYIYIYKFNSSEPRPWWSRHSFRIATVAATEIHHLWKLQPPRNNPRQRSQKNLRNISPTHRNFFWRTLSTFLDRTAMLHEQQLTLALVGDTQLPRWQWILGWSWPPKCIGTLEKRWRAKGHWELD